MPAKNKAKILGKTQRLRPIKPDEETASINGKKIGDIKQAALDAD